MALLAALAKVRDAPFLLDAIRAADGLTAAAGQDGGPHAVKVLTRVVDDLVEGRDDDQVIAIAAVHALGAVFDDGAGAALSDCCPIHAPFCANMPRGRWDRARPDWTRSAGWSRALPPAGSPPSSISARSDAGRRPPPITSRWRSRVRCSPGTTRTAGPGWWRPWSGPGAVADRTLHRVAADSTEPIRSRMAAIAALGDRSPQHDGAALIRRLATSTGDLGAVARLAAFDITRSPTGDVDRESGLVVAQLFLHADLDRELSRAGAGDNGGIATMLVRLGDALATQPDVSRVVTMSRGSVQATVDALTDPPADHVLAPIPLMSEPTDAASAWPTMVAAERGIRRALTAHRVDVLHPRMAEVGSMAAARWRPGWAFRPCSPGRRIRTRSSTRWT